MIGALFLILSLVIIFSARYLSIYGDIIGDKKGLEKSWIGVILLSTVTSLPEFITSSSSSLIGAPDMAISNVFGSNMFNVFIIVFLDFFAMGKKSFTNNISIKHFLSGFISIFMTLIFIVGSITGGFQFLNIDIFSILIIVSYFIFMKVLYRFEKTDLHEDKEKSADKDSKKPANNISLKKAYTLFGANALVVVFAGVILVKVADKISSMEFFGYQLGGSFVGLILLAIVTSLPELTVSIQAVKMGSYDMAAGNIFGSNIFNIAIIFVADIFYINKIDKAKHSIFSLISNEKFYLLAPIFSIALTLILMNGIFLKKKKRKIDTYLVLILYIVGMFVLYKIKPEM